jgi:hypothetical protein
MYVEMQHLCRDDGGVIVFLFKDYVEATSNKVGQANYPETWKPTDAVMLNVGGMSHKNFFILPYY